MAQVALSVTLLVATGLLVHSLQRLYRVDPGIDSDRVLVAGVYPALLRYDHARELQLYRTLVDTLEATPGIESVSLARFGIDRGGLNFVSPRLFGTLGVRVVRGRDFSAAETASGARVAVVNETAAKQIYPRETSVGRTVPDLFARELAGQLEIIGVVRDIRTTYRRREPQPAVYVPYTLAPADRLGQADLFVRTTGDAAAMVPALRRAVQSVEPDLALLNLQVLTTQLDASVRTERSTATLIGSFGLLALLLVTIGLYGTMSQAVARRTKELGIRLSLGAGRADMLLMVLRETAVMVAMGFGLGIPIALVAARGLSTMLFGIGTTDPITLVAVVVLMFSAALLAGYVPARRASRIDPIIALRCE